MLLGVKWLCDVVVEWVMCYVIYLVVVFDVDVVVVLLWFVDEYWIVVEFVCGVVLVVLEWLVLVFVLVFDFVVIVCGGVIVIVEYL